MQLPIRTRSLARTAETAGVLRWRREREEEREKGKREISTMAFGADVPFPSPSFRAGRMDGWINPMSSHAVVVALAILCAAMLQARFHTYLARRGQHDGGGRDADEF